GPEKFTIAGILKADGPASAFGGNIVFIPLAAAQRFFDRDNSFSRIAPAIYPPATLNQGRAALRAQFQIEPPPGHDSAFRNILAQFETILTCISVLAAVIGLFIVYNTASLSTVERAKEIGILRALGARRREVLAVITSESAAIGVIGAVLGL